MHNLINKKTRTSVLTSNEIRKVQIDPDRAFETVEAVRNAFKNSNCDVQLSGKFFLTKKGGSQLLTFDFKREVEIEALAKIRLSQAGAWNDFIGRYKNFHPTVEISDCYVPDTYAVSLKACNDPIVTKYNVFLPFPKVLDSEINTEHCTIEFVDKWSTFFEQCISPCVETVFTETSINYYNSLVRNNVACTAYLFSLFHELSHRFGAFRVIPSPRHDLSISTFQMNVLSELQANVLVIHHVPEILEFQLFWLFHHVFLHARWGTKSDLAHGWIEVDNDSCLGAYVVEKAITVGALEWIGDKLKLNAEKIHGLATLILAELEELTLELQHSSNHEVSVQKWLEKTIPKHENRLCFSPEVQEIFRRTQHIPEAMELEI